MCRFLSKDVISKILIAVIAAGVKYRVEVVNR